MIRPVLFLLFSVFVLTGCGSFSSVKTARPDPGFGLGIEFYSYGLLGERVVATNSEAMVPFLFDLSTWGRILPFKEFWEVGGKISFWEVSADSKFIFWTNDTFGLAADIEAGFPYLYSFRTADLTASLLFTIQPTQAFSVTLVPKYRWAMLCLPMVGGSVVFSFINNETLSLLLDISYIRFLPNSYSQANDDFLSQMISDVYNSFDALSATIGIQFHFN